MQIFGLAGDSRCALPHLLISSDIRYENILPSTKCNLNQSTSTLCNTNSNALQWFAKLWDWSKNDFLLNSTLPKSSKTRCVTGEHICALMVQLIPGLVTLWQLIGSSLAPKLALLLTVRVSSKAFTFRLCFESSLSSKWAGQWSWKTLPAWRQRSYSLLPQMCALCPLLCPADPHNPGLYTPQGCNFLRLPPPPPPPPPPPIVEED